ncbi:gamma-tubulin complex component 5 [Teleopsis dalmanni]|uniref:gamma-tubulin complex component 5 n=1 Tax=Teleopsis dalmanni TaxID=139649 RepID=UPI0018CD5303|nr:gamma-tubulin complex component 5 [Teleopsis dalmanni]
MSIQEIRNEIIKENIPQLVKSLTGFKDDDENLKVCESFAWSVLRTYRKISISSHEIKRKIEGIQEKFTAENCAEYAKKFGDLCNVIITHPLCLNHYEFDLNWALVDFFISIAYNPAAVLRKNKHKIKLLEVQSDEQNDNKIYNKKYWQNLLNEDLPPLSTFSSESELSDWSNDEESNANQDETTSPPFAEKTLNETVLIQQKILKCTANIKPPQKVVPYVLYDDSKAKQNVDTLLQDKWWIKNYKTNAASIRSVHPEAHTAEIYEEFLKRNTYLICEPVSTATEYCLLREIIWMFFVPKDCFFFKVKGDSINMREYVTIPSLTVKGLLDYMENKILPHIKMMHRLRTFIESMQENQGKIIPKTVECYAYNVNALLNPVEEDLLNYEKRLMNQQNFDTNTLMNFQYTLRQSLKHLENVFMIHIKVEQNLLKLPPHVASTFVLTRLLKYCQENVSTEKVNIGMSLFLSTFKVYLSIINDCWNLGVLGDWRHEFIGERKDEDDPNLYIRTFNKDEDSSLNIPVNISNVITTSQFYHLMVKYSKEAVYSLNILNDINRITDLHKSHKTIEIDLYEVFINKIITIVKKINSDANNTLKADVTLDTEITTTLDSKASDVERICTSTMQTQLTTSDPFLTFAFSYDDNKPEVISKAASGSQYHNWGALQICQYFNKFPNGLQLNLMVLDALAIVLKTRLNLTNSFLIKLYFEEYCIEIHLQNIRKVFLLESADLMYYFFEKLFTQIESNELWANEYILTSRLDDVINAKLPWMTAMFRVKLAPNYTTFSSKVIKAVDEFLIVYNTPLEIAYIINDKQLEYYNQLMNFLLKVKYAVMTLNNLTFSTADKRMRSLSPFDTIDLTMRRLEMLRLWMMYAVQNIQNYLMTTVLSSENQNFDTQLKECKNLTEIKDLHKNYINIIIERCFLTNKLKHLKLGIEQLLHMVLIVKLDWADCIKQLNRKHPLAEDVDENLQQSRYNIQIDELEITYIRIHQYIADSLHNEVYLNQNNYLSGLDSAFCTSVPY